MGIDYGMGLANVDRATGIRFGVISQNECLQAWCDGSEGVYPDPEPENCPTCEGEGEIEGGDGATCTCDDCDGTGNATEDDWAMDCIEPIGHVLKDKQYHAESSGDSGDIFVLKSPYYTRCAFCSPCAPGAGYLTSEADDCKAYCFGHDFFYDHPDHHGKAPYRVFRVSDDSEVFPD